ncbi:Cullin-domain-containing protein [Gigaspora margarita]|uniref:Cullin-domain-containing protein n=1 Tax=Gigaspora margarita TaxID=4874 RepID=A0A8H4ALA2_GIGMA|nr:Cullin-domain-containing protein [Gigaspora margarita]
MYSQSLIPSFFTYKNVDENDPSLLDQSLIFLDDNEIKNDIYIIAGYDWNHRMFKVHTSILKDRCDYFKTELSNQSICKNSDGIIIFYKEDISPEIFELILEYIYTGEVSNRLYDTNVNILDFIIAADEMLLPKLVDSLESHLIDKYLKQFSPEIEAWISCLITINKEQFLSRFEKCIYEICLEHFKEIIPGNVNTKIEPRDYISALLEVRIMYIDTIATFGSDINLITSLDKVFQKIVNQNHVTGESKTKSPELLAQFCDYLLKKDSDKSYLEDIMTIFKYVEDKEIFLKFFSKLFAKRLINKTSRSEDAESSLISKLKETCGIGYISKLQRMLNCVELSKDLNDQFKNYCIIRSTGVNKQVDFSFLVLDAASWPFCQLTTSFINFIIPKELEETFKNFGTFYHSKHAGRKLKSLFHFSKGELKANYCKKTYIFKVSLYQMGILLQYNNNTSYTFEELKQKTDLYDFVLTEILKTLIQTKVLKLSNSNEVGCPLSRYELNMNFKSYKTCVQLNVPIHLEQSEVKTKNTNDTCSSERLFTIQKTIIRIIQCRKTMNRNDIVNEVINNCIKDFKPKILDIKKCIDILLEKDYLERVEGSKDMFQYLA